MNVSIQPSHIVKHRGLIALSALGIHICIGSVYAWSVYTKPIQDIIGWSLTEVTLSFSIAIFFLGLSAAVMGKFVERNDPRISALIATTLFCAGTVGSGLAISLESKYALYFFYGVLGGCGLGIGYISPVSTLVKWFPDRRGMATGIAIMGFGFASAVSGPAIKLLIDAYGIPVTFTILGSIYFIIMLTASLYLSPPPDDYIPPRYQQSLQSGQKKSGQIYHTPLVKTLSEHCVFTAYGLCYLLMLPAGLLLLVWLHH